MSGPGRGPGRLAGGVGPASHREDAREIETYHDWLRAWQCVWAIRPTATILRVFRLVPGHQAVELLQCTTTLLGGRGQ